MKREDYISWDEYFMGIAMLSAMRSKDNNSQVGACIVSPENKILSLGYNGTPIGCNDDAADARVGIADGYGLLRQLQRLIESFHDGELSLGMHGSESVFVPERQTKARSLPRQEPGD